MHKGPCFVMPNAWDPGSAVLLAEAGFAAIATTSAGVAFASGRGDYLLGDAKPLSRTETFDRVRPIVAAVSIPVNGDLEDGYGVSPDEVAETIRLAIDSGLAGANIEDQSNGRLYDEDLAVERIVAAHEARSGTDFVLTARTDVYQQVPDALGAAVQRLNRFREAGADCLYAPFCDDVATLVREVTGPVSNLIGPKDTVADLAAAGVTRISTGGAIARAALGFVRDVAWELQDRGTFTLAAAQYPHMDLNALFARHPR